MCNSRPVLFPVPRICKQKKGDASKDLDSVTSGEKRHPDCPGSPVNRIHMECMECDEDMSWASSDSSFSCPCAYASVCLVWNDLERNPYKNTYSKTRGRFRMKLNRPKFQGISTSHPQTHRPRLDRRPNDRCRFVGIEAPTTQGPSLREKKRQDYKYCKNARTPSHDLERGP